MRLPFLIILLILCILVNSHSFSFRMAIQAMKMLRGKIEAIIDKTIENTKCAKDLRIVVTDALHGKLWALKMIDASSKIHPGLLMGNIYQFGHYDECLSIEEDHDGNVITGQYCSVLLQPHEDSARNGFLGSLLDTSAGADFVKIKRDQQTDVMVKQMKMVFGICIPKSCSINNAQHLMSALENHFDLPGHVQFVDVLCDYKGKPVEPYDVDPYIEIFFLTMAIIVFMSTLYDLFRKNKSEDNYWITLSLYFNSKKLCSTDCENRNITCLHGLKVLAMLWIISAHKIGVTVFMGNTNAAYYFEWVRRIESCFTVSGFYAVDTYLIISGLLVIYIKMQMSEKHQITLVLYYAHRILRLTPALGATILFTISILKKLSHGPFWHLLIRKLSLSCHYNWWLTLLFLTNFLPMRYQCVEPTWYLAVDTQLYLISPLILFNINKYPRKTLIWMIIACVLSRLYAFLITFQKNLGAYIGQFSDDYLFYIYQSPIHQYTPWALGIFSGYFIYRNKDKKIELPKKLRVGLLVLSFTTMLGCILYYNVLTNSPYSAIHAAFFNTFSNLLWSLSVCCIIILCSTGNGGIVNEFLSAPIFIILSKLTYSMFLMHMPIIFALAGFQKEAGNFNNLRHFREYFSDLFLIIAVAALWCLVFESPVFNILTIAEKRALKKKKRVSKGTNTQAQVNKENRIFLWGMSFVATKKDVTLKKD